MKTGKIIQVMGPVVDVEFEDENLPAIRDALEVLNGDKKSVMEVAQHIGNNTVRCIMLAASEGLHKDMEVIAEGSGIKVPPQAPASRHLSESRLSADCSTCSVKLSMAEHSLIQKKSGKSTENLQHLKNRILQKRFLRQVSR